jgi:dihydroorotate dehydrogenase (NAD+) catalytic subunit
VTRGELLRRLKAPGLKLGTVSGVLTTRPRLIEWADANLPELELITTKSYQVRPNPGNREPILVEPQAGCFGNAVGLRNPGLAEGLRELEALRRGRRMRCLLAVSLSADCIEDFVLLARRFAGVADLLELNFSCPHARAGYGSAIGADPGVVGQFLAAIRRATAAPLFAKLTPNVADIGAIARAAMEAGADGIAAVNTVGPEVFREPLSGLPILSNPNGHKGGKSGLWIREAALRAVAEVRRAVGPEMPILGMGGVATGEDARAMSGAGADVVGIGSALARVARQSRLPAYLRALRADALGGSREAESFLSRRSKMEYRAHRVTETRDLSGGLRLLVLDGALGARAGEFAFLFLPGIGEKPFSVARPSPLTFLVRRRGEFTQALFGLEAGDRLWVRGTCGAPAPVSARGRAYLVAGGTGLAVIPSLAAMLRERGKRAELYYGVSAAEEGAALEALGLGGDLPCLVVPDSGRPGRVLEVMAEELGAAAGGAGGEAARVAAGGAGSRAAASAAFYNVGPHPFIDRAMRIEEELGACPADIYACLETPTMCGVGLCGGCECGGRLLCKEGTFVSLQYLRAAGVSLAELDAGSHAPSPTQRPGVVPDPATSAPAAAGSSRRTAGRPAAASTAR